MSDAYLAQALALAKRGAGQTSPNPAVGALVVRDGAVVGEGFHTYAGVKHAEVLALDQAGDRARGATVYVSLEPCAHTGRTGPCAEALINAGVTRVIAAMQDPNPQVAGQGIQKLREAGIEVQIDESLTAEAEHLNEPFVHAMKTGRPLVTMKAAVTLDGKIAAPEDNRGWITSEQARAHVQTLRYQHDAILTGIGTVLEDDPLLNDRSGLPRSRPLLRIVLDSRLRLPVNSRMVQSCENDLLVVCTSAAPTAKREQLEQAGVQVLISDGSQGRTGVENVVDYLAQRQYRSLMIEAGSKVNWAVLEAGIVDKIFYYYAAKILGGLQSLPVVGGAGRTRRRDAIRFHDVKLHPIARDEFAVEAYLVR